MSHEGKVEPSVTASNFRPLAIRKITSSLLGGWTNPFQKYARQIGSFPQVGMKIKHIFKTIMQFFVGKENAVPRVTGWWSPSYTCAQLLTAHDPRLQTKITNPQKCTVLPRKSLFKGTNSSCMVSLYLVGGFNPFEKYESNWESSPNGGEKSIWNHHLDIISKWEFHSHRIHWTGIFPYI